MHFTSHSAGLLLSTEVSAVWNLVQFGLTTRSTFVYFE